MSQILSALTTAAPMAAGWGVHSVWMRRRLTVARRDPLSGLPTRAAFESTAAHTLARHQHVAVLLVDLDGFKAVNDRYGHAAGDAVIRATAGSLQEGVADRRGAVVARLGGDEFAAVVPLVNPVVLPWLLGGVHGAITAPLRHAGQDLVVGASIGAALSSDLAPAGTRPSGSAALAVLLRLADEAMYAVKRTGGGWNYPGVTAPGVGTTAGRRTGRPGTHGKDAAA
ncbi:GGDEF domain-containing protein [Streptomyces sp. ODS05-4]|uniref:GGDEF domain-containing protein n=1 Tax=Streptomyces sp. ODS05-4 TaxID=2944939 RepID=UPI00210E10A3|nr:GGDEF domain-containing protein [Streptomyces sp. ODS05-4]